MALDKQCDKNINLPCEAKGKSEQGDSYFSDVYLVGEKKINSFKML